MPFAFTNPAGFPYRPGALFLGLDPATGQEVGLSVESHAITVARARAGKGAAVLIPNARRWSHSLLTIDPKGENAAASWEHREAMGQAVYAIDPMRTADIPDRLRASFNPLDGIDADGFTAREDVKVIADGMVRRTNPKNAEWDNGAVNILAGVMAYVIGEAPPEHRTLKAARDVLMQTRDDLYQDAQRMVACTACGGLAKAAGLTIMDALENGKGMPPQLLDAAKRHSEWLDSVPIAQALNASSFDLSALKSGKASVYLILPAAYIDTHAAFLRLFVRTAINAMAKAGANAPGRCLFLLDEFFQLGKVDEITKSAGLMPGYGVHLWLFLQDLGQLQELYGEHGSKTFFANADAHMFFGIDQDADACKMVSDRIGLLTPDEVAAPFSPIAPPEAEKVVMDMPGWHDGPGTAAANENERRRIEHMNAQRRALHDHAMRKVGSPRLAPDEVAELTGKPPAAKVARSMIVFGPARAVLNLTLATHFQEEERREAQREAVALAKLERQQEAQHSIARQEYPGFRSPWDSFLNLFPAGFAAIVVWSVVITGIQSSFDAEAVTAMMIGAPFAICAFVGGNWFMSAPRFWLQTFSWWMIAGAAAGGTLAVQTHENGNLLWHIIIFAFGGAVFPIGVLYLREKWRGAV